MALYTNDNRYLPRWITQNRVVCKLDDAIKPWEAETQDLSCAGICIRTAKLPGLARNINMTIYLTDHARMEAQGRIVWTKHSPGSIQLGIKFISLSPENQDLLLEHAFQIDRKKFLKQFFKGWNNHAF